MAEYIIRLHPRVPEFYALEGELIRCKDCMHHRTNSQGQKYCGMFRHTAEDDDYCSRAKVDPAGLTVAGSHHIEDDTTEG